MTRPIILIGYGSYGFRIIHNLLSSSSMRGLLEWNSSETKDAKKIKNLEVIWIKGNNFIEGEADPQPDDEDPFFKDLYRQINQLDSPDDVSISIKNTIKKAAHRLLSPDQNATFTLDVFFLAGPNEDNIKLSQLDRISRKVIGELNAIPNFKMRMETEPVLNFIEILDYENVNEGIDAAEIKQSLENWQDQRSRGGPSYGFGRIYICNGQGQKSIRNPRQRKQEVVLFLEFLLFENIRESDLKHLYQSKKDESILSTIGIWLVEHDISKLSHYAAATFSKAWLEYISGDHPDHHKHKDEYLTPGALKQLDLDLIINNELDLSRIKNEINEKLNNAKKQLNNSVNAGLEKAVSDLEATYIGMETRAVQELAEELSTLRQSKLMELRKNLFSGVSNDLHLSTHPAPLGNVLSWVNETLNKEGKHIWHEESSVRTLSKSFIKQKIGKYQEWYLQFLKERIDRQKSFYVWFVAIVILSLALFPIVDSLLKEFDPYLSTTILKDLFSIINSYKLFILFFLLGITALLPYLARKHVDRRLKETDAWFTHQDQGRIIHGINSVDQDKILISRITSDIRSCLQSEIQQILLDLKAILECRQSEIRWLVRKLNDYHKKIEPFVQESVSVYRYDTTRKVDLDIIQKYLAPEKERFLGQIDEGPKIFAEWESKYNFIFLAPLHFIGELSEFYYDKYIQDPNIEKCTENIFNQLNTDFTNIARQFGTGFSTLQQRGMPENQNYALISKEFKSDNRITSQIQDTFGITLKSTYELERSSRIYLVTATIGMEPSVLGFVANGN